MEKVLTDDARAGMRQTPGAEEKKGGTAMTYTKKAPAEGAYTKEKRDADTREMIRAINARADRADYARRCAAYEEAMLAQGEKERRQKRWSFVCIAIGALTLAAAYGLLWWHGEQILAAYGG